MKSSGGGSPHFSEITVDLRGGHSRRSRNKIDLLGQTFRQLPRRGLPAIGYSIETELPLLPVDQSMRCSERRDGKVIGELAVELFAASLVIDRDGVLSDRARDAVGGEPVAITLPGASGYRSEAVVRETLPYRYAFAIAHDGAIDGGILITIRCARPDWPAAEAMLRSLRVLTRHGTVPANDDAGPLLPLLSTD
jgi:hypothetical protein